ncbi:MAG TPA: SDR family NAD(P)-dependent oxidoreductase, partial [Chloroflexota bacterium]|nr:SDR family NAD(P)-dependent oxidoreductase [Chloroflexota bacterium]
MNSKHTMNDLSGRTTMVVGASRGLGYGIATAFAEAGDRVVAVSRTTVEFPQLTGTSGTILREVADAREATVPASLFDR